MAMANHLSFENSNFSSSFSSSISSLLHTSSLCDVTLVCDDGQLSAHKIILAASSSFFSSVFQANPHNHPLMYLRGVKTDQLQSLLQFIYAGVTAVQEENVSSFLAVAADLKIGGLSGNQDGFEEKEKEKPRKDFSNLDPLKQDEEKFSGGIAADIKDVEFPDDTFENFDDNSRTEQTDRNERTPSVETVAENFAKSPTMDTQNAMKIRTDPQIQANPMIMISHNETPYCAGKPLTGQPRVQLVSSNVPTTKRRNLIPPSIFCNVCQKTDYKTNNIKVHMDCKIEVQCKACRLFFANCYSLSKHMKGRCKQKRNKMVEGNA